ncbi:CsgE family curli-type amyloid fiber assembly protein [uncultured Dokdonia sp.]|uniref:CsgE family curli-type amyloid fiber assembly protein n=1 Tax=uncultured Dokdonia sp. TaxID=575653 RepID=UPI00262280FC|nr:CsgE family curli-type amyloid fiber assembly protein [uncultured Dokdonia sp.]
MKLTNKIAVNTIKKTTLLIVFFIGVSAISHAQLFNKDIQAKILIERNSEFYTFHAAARNKTSTDINLKYDYSVFRTDKEGNVVKNNQTDLFFLKGDEKKILSTLTVNYNVDDKIILLLLVYDKDNKPIGKDRIVLEQGGKTVIDINRNTPKTTSQDEAVAQDGYTIDGLVLQKTLTKSGRDFFRMFYSEYYNRQIRSPKNILIKEVPGRRRNTLITVEVDGKLVWQFFAQPRKEFLTNMVRISLQRVLSFLNRLEKQNEQFIRY